MKCVVKKTPSLVLGRNQHVSARDWRTQSNLISKLANIEAIKTTVGTDFLLVLEPAWLVVQQENESVAAEDQKTRQESCESG